MTSQEQVLSWKGEKVIFLAGYSQAPFFGDSAPGDRIDYYRADKAHEGLPREQYAGKTGVVTDVKLLGKRPFGDAVIFELEITVDGSGDKIIAHDDSDNLGFISEMKAAETWSMGKTFWAKGPLDLWGAPAGGKKTWIRVRNTERMTASRPEWGAIDGPNLCFKTAGGEGCLSEKVCFDARFHPGYGEKSCADGDGAGELLGRNVYLQDPHRLFPGWSPAIWAAIENREIAIGMTEKMAQVACGKELDREGSVLEKDGKVSAIYRCGDRSFLVVAGKVARYVVTR
jgi:hypothetical protein